MRGGALGVHVCGRVWELGRTQGRACGVQQQQQQEILA